MTDKAKVKEKVKKPRKRKQKKTSEDEIHELFFTEANLALAYSLRLDRLAALLGEIEPLNEVLASDIDVLYSVVEFLSTIYGITPEKFNVARELLKLQDPNAECYEV